MLRKKGRRRVEPPLAVVPLCITTFKTDSTYHSGYRTFSKLTNFHNNTNLKYTVFAVKADTLISETSRLHFGQQAAATFNIGHAR